MKVTMLGILPPRVREIQIKNYCLMSKVNESDETRMWATIQSNARRTNYYVVSFGDHKISMYNLFGVEVSGRLLA